MCNCVINKALITAHCSTELICAKEGTQPHEWQRREVAAKMTIKKGYFSQFSTFPMLQANMYIVFSRTPDFGF